MRKYTFLLATLGLLFITACQKDSLAPLPETIDESQFLQLNTIEDLEAFEKSLENNEIANSRSSWHGKVIRVPRNSKNALQKAIRDAGRYGLVLLEKGDHYEEGTVLIEQPVYILGRKGAAIVSSVPIQPNIEEVLNAAIHIKNTNRVTIWGVEFKSAINASGAAIIVENANKTTIAKSSMNDFQYSIILQKANHSLVWKNNIVVSGAWLTATEFLDSEGIVAMNGNHNAIHYNTVSNGVFGIFYSGSHGAATHNETFGNFFGIIICKFAPAITIPSGPIQSEVSGNNWLLRNNYSHDNFDVGYLIIDGANNNTLIDNRGGNNARVDMELTSDSERFGFFTPKSYENTVVAGKYPNLTIKDCGTDNVVNGGMQIDTSADACF